MENSIPFKNAHNFVLAVMDFLQKKKKDHIHHLDLKATSTTSAIAHITMSHPKLHTLVLKLEELEEQKIKVTEISFNANLLKGISCSLGPFAYQDPKAPQESFEPIVPLLPPFWGGGI